MIARTYAAAILLVLGMVLALMLATVAREHVATMRPAGETLTQEGS